jgi:alpha 1,2-mannosyltransferase
MLKKDEIHFFDDIAYYHVPFTHCPTSEQTRLDLKCHCNPHDNFDWNGYSCELMGIWPRKDLHLTICIGTSRFFEVNDMTKPAGYEQQQ